MRRILKRRPSPSMVVAFIALVAVMAGTGYAATTLPQNSVGSKQLKNNAVTSKDLKNGAVTSKKIKNGAVTSNKVKDGSLTGADINESTLGTVPSAANANHARSADSATNANHAGSAESATNAGNATNLGGQPANAYMRNDAVQRGTFILSQGTTGQTVFSNGPLSVTADCTSSAGILTVTVHDVSTVDNWLDFTNRNPTAGTNQNSSTNDGGTGNENGTFNRIEIMAPDGHVLRGQVALGVNWPNAGQCFVSGWAIPTS
jgi:hypothetical protein